MKYLFLILFIVGCGSNLVAFSVDDNSFNIDRRIVDTCEILKDYSSCLEVGDRNKCENEVLNNPTFVDIEKDKNFLSRQYCIDNELDKFTGQSCQSIAKAASGKSASCRGGSATKFSYTNKDCGLDEEWGECNERLAAEQAKQKAGYDNLSLCKSQAEKVVGYYNLLKCDKLLSAINTTNATMNK